MFLSSRVGQEGRRVGGQGADIQQGCSLFVLSSFPFSAVIFILFDFFALHCCYGSWYNISIEFFTSFSSSTSFLVRITNKRNLSSLRFLYSLHDLLLSNISFLSTFLYFIFFCSIVCIGYFNIVQLLLIYVLYLFLLRLLNLFCCYSVLLNWN